MACSRSIIKSDFRILFASKIDNFLNEQEIAGPDGLYRKHLLPSTYNLISELSFALRENFSVLQTSKAIYLLSYCMHSAEMPISSQTIAVRTLNKLIDTIHQSKDVSGKTYFLLMRVLHCVTTRFQTVMDSVSALSSQDQSQYIADSSDAPGTAKDLKIFIREMMSGLATVVWCVGDSYRKLRAPPSFGQREELSLLSKFLVNGLKCFEVFDIACSTDSSDPDAPYDLFASVFTKLEPSIFKEIFSEKMSALYNEIMARKSLKMISIAQNLLANPKVSMIFVDCFFCFLSERLSCFNQGTSEKTSTLSSLFRVVVGSLMLYSTNENAIRIHIKK